MTSPTPPPLAVGVLADVTVKVTAIDNVAMTATIRVIDNNGGFITAAVPLPQGVVRPIAFAVALGDILESTTSAKETGVVRWLSEDTLMWSYSPSGIPARSTVGWTKLGNFPLP